MSEKIENTISTVFGLCCGFLAAQGVFGIVDQVFLNWLVTMLNFIFISLYSAVGYYEVVFSE